MTRTYDVKCEELAGHFLVDSPELLPKKSELASHIQEAVEDWFASKEERRKQAERNFPFSGSF